MEKIETYEQYSQVLSTFKQGRTRCKTNKMMMREELTALIEAGKLYYEQTGNTLWFFSDEDYFYFAHLYAPADSPVRMKKQDKDVVVELMGNESRYDEQMDRELLAAGFEKNGKYLEYGAQMDEIIDDVRQENRMARAFWEKRGFTIRAATKADYPELRTLWLDQLGMNTYNVQALTDAQLEEMERYDRCPIMCDPQGKIVASSLYLKSGKISYGYITATAHQGSGLGTVTLYEGLVRTYDEDCKKTLCWARDDNYRSANLIQHTQKPTGKFFWQFVCRAGGARQ